MFPSGDESIRVESVKEDILGDIAMHHTFGVTQFLKTTCVGPRWQESDSPIYKAVIASEMEISVSVMLFSLLLFYIYNLIIIIKKIYKIIFTL